MSSDFIPAYQRENEVEIQGEQAVIQGNEAMQPINPGIEAPQPNAQNLNDPDIMEIELNPVEQGRNLTSEEVINALVKYLTKKDLFNCRQISKTWNTVLYTRPVESQLTGMVREKWYKDMQNCTFNYDTTLKWKTLKLHHFGYRRNSADFKTYWHCAASALDTLTIDHCSLECDGFAFLLDHCPVLRTLNLKSCKLRDLYDVHNPGKRQRIGAPCEGPRPIVQSLRNLNVESMWRFEQCFMDYLNTRTGSLESITLSKCFHTPPPGESLIDDTILSQMAAEFLRNMLALFRINAHTMTKYGLHDNNFQTEMFPLVTPPEEITIPELALTLKTPQNGDYTSIIRFMNNCRGVEKLSLRFLGNINTSCIQALVRGCQASLQKFELIVDGNIIMTADNTSISLDFLREFPQLQDIRIHDSKRYHPLDVANFIGGGRRTSDPDNIPATILTPVSPSFLQNLPPNLTKLTLDKYVPLENITSSLSSHLNSFRGLTKLEVRGPWVHSMLGVVQIIAREFLQLRTLALTACGLTDVQVTALDKELAATTRFRLNFPAEGLRSAQSCIDKAKWGIRTKNADLGVGIRNLLSDLQYLTHVDLSNNPELTNVSLIDGLVIQGLKSLNLSGCTRMKDRSLEYLSIMVPGLEELHVKYCKHITKRGLNKFLTESRKIKKVYTTKTTQKENQALPGHIQNAYTLNPNYNDITVITVGDED